MSGDQAPVTQIRPCQDSSSGHRGPGGGQGRGSLLTAAVHLVTLEMERMYVSRLEFLNFDVDIYIMVFICKQKA